MRTWKIFEVPPSGEQVLVARQILNGHEAGNGGDKPRIEDLTNTEPVLYST
jgi:hypothetical protein